MAEPSMMGKDEMNLLRPVATGILEWFVGFVTNRGVNDYWHCLNNDDEIHDTVLLELKEIREQIPDDDEQLDQTLQELTTRLALKSGRTKGHTKKIVETCLERFVTDCASNPGPEEVWEYGEPPSLKWEIKFSEEAFRLMVSMMGKALKLRFEEERTEVRINCSNMQFKSSFEIQTNFRYDSDSNQFVLSCSPLDTRAVLERKAALVDKSLSDALALAYGTEFKLGDVIAIMPLSKGGNEYVLKGRANRSSLDSPKELSEDLLRKLWKPISSASRHEDAQMAILVSKLKSLSGPPEDRLVDLMTCFEILLSDGDEIRFKLAVRGAALLNFLGQTSTFDTILRAYKNRNDIVHGNKRFVKLSEGVLSDDNAKLTGWLRVVVVARILGGSDKGDLVKYSDLLVKQSVDAKLINQSGLVALAEFGRRVALAKMVNPTV